jgi:hypothetical protein
MRPNEAPLRKVIFIFMIVAGLSGQATHAQSSRKLKAADARTLTGLDIYLLIGQSNMAGRAQILAPDYDTLRDTWLFKGDSLTLWEPAVNPLNKYSTIRRELSIQQLSPGYYFAKTMMAAEPGKRIGLVVNARGGTSIDLWAPGTTYFNDAVSRARQAMHSGTLKAILWHQGESDVKKRQEYPEKIVRLISELRTALNNPDLPFIAGEVAEEKPGRAEFNVLLRATLSKVPYAAVVTASGLTTYDSTHFDTPSMRILGERYARETRIMLENKGLKVKK